MAEGAWMCSRSPFVPFARCLVNVGVADASPKKYAVLNARLVIVRMKSLSQSTPLTFSLNGHVIRGDFDQSANGQTADVYTIVDLVAA